MDMTADVRAAFVDILMRQDWMDDETKKAAKVKVRVFVSVSYSVWKGYFHCPGFDQNTVRDSGRRWRDTGFDCYPGSKMCQNVGTDAVERENDIQDSGEIRSGCKKRKMNRCSCS